MNKEELINSLIEKDLERFRYSIWATFTNDGGLEYALCLKGEKPNGFDIHLSDIGGAPCVKYNHDYIEFVIDDSIDEFYDKRGYIW